MDVDDVVCLGVVVVDTDVVADVVRRQAPRALPPYHPGGLCTGTTEEKTMGERTGKNNVTCIRKNNVPCIVWLFQETFLAFKSNNQIPCLV